MKIDVKVTVDGVDYRYVRGRKSSLSVMEAKYLNCDLNGKCGTGSKTGSLCGFCDQLFSGRPMKFGHFKKVEDK